MASQIKLRRSATITGHPGWGAPYTLATDVEIRWVVPAIPATMWVNGKPGDPSRLCAVLAFMLARLKEQNDEAT